jgi:thiamine biosynthesis lipoprotein
MNRRRFLAIAAALPATHAWAGEPQEWRSVALGAEVRIVLNGAAPQQAQRSFARVAAALRRVEGHFSLHRDSELTRLNRTGRLSHPPPAMLGLFRLAGEVHAATGGMFDPSIQPLWLALATSGDVEAARALAGWNRVRMAADEIALEPGMQLTFNGIAQGHAADEVADLLRAEGFTDVLIDTGEIAALGARPGGDPWRAAIAMPDGTVIGRSSLTNRALATSSPMATRIGAGAPHILNPHGGAPLWRLASVSAPRAALADSLSTAFCLMERAAIDAALGRFPRARLEALI